MPGLQARPRGPQDSPAPAAGWPSPASAPPVPSGAGTLDSGQAPARALSLLCCGMGLDPDWDSPYREKE